MKPNLSSTTLIIVDCVDLSRAALALERCTSKCNFASAKLLSSLKSSKQITTEIPHISSIEQYSLFIIKELYKYFDTDFVLVAQHDGFVWMPHMWTEDFLQYDYIGAPWPKEVLQPGTPPFYDVGNGGFSLRSKKLQQTLGTDENIKLHPAEDVAICQINREYLEDKGFKFAPASVAKKFSWECMPCSPAFGSHGRMRLT